MRSLVLFSALLLSAVTAQAQTTSTSPPPASTLILVGSNCTSSSQCRESAECLTSVCGNTGATCTYNAQCAFNLCDTNTNTCSGALILGAPCTSSAQCAYGADCYAVNSMLIARCGNFQATCTNSSQCAYNTCVNGFCNGQLALGTICVSSEQCVNGAECYAPMKDAGYAYCGAWNASCTADNQCAWNTCLQGTCSGAIPLGQSCHLYTSVCANGAYCYSPSKYTDGVCGAYYAPCMNDTQCWDHSCLRGSCSGTLFNGTSSSSSSSSSSSMSSTSSSSTSLSTSSSSSTSEPTYPNNTITSTSTRTSLTTLTSCPPSVECSGQTTKWTGSEGPTSCPASVTCVVVYATGSVVTVSQTTVVTGSGKATGSASPTATPILVPASGALGMDEVATEGYIVALIGAVVVAFGMGLL